MILWSFCNIKYAFEILIKIYSSLSVQLNKNVLVLKIISIWNKLWLTGDSHLSDLLTQYHQCICHHTLYPLYHLEFSWQYLIFCRWSALFPDFFRLTRALNLITYSWITNIRAPFIGCLLRCYIALTVVPFSFKCIRLSCEHRTIKRHTSRYALVYRPWNLLLEFCFISVHLFTCDFAMKIYMLLVLGIHDNNNLSKGGDQVFSPP